MSASVTTGSSLAPLLGAYGVDTVFGIPGVHTIELYRGLAGTGIRHVTPRHEQGAGFMADGYARASGRPGVCFVVSGPGMTNILTAMGQAYADSIPMLVVSAVNAHGRMGTGEGWLHELPDQRGTVAGVAAFSRTIHHPRELAPALAQAFAVFDGARPRPVHLEIPLDVMSAPAEPDPRGPPARVARPAAAAASVAAAASWLSDAAAPVMLVGGGAVGEADGVRALAERLDAPVAMTINARGILSADHPLAVSLSASTAATRALVASADVVLALGTELGPTDYDMFEDGGFAVPGRLIRADIDPVQLHRGAVPQLTLLGDAGEIAAALISAVPARPPRDGAARAARARSGCRALSLAARGDLHLLDIVRDALPDSAIVGDSTQLVYAGNLGFAAATAGSYFNSATGFGTLGYALPAAIGAWLAAARPVVALIGDGGLQFTLAELASAREAQAQVIALVHDNGGYGEIAAYMAGAGVAPLGVDLATPDIAGIARACGWSVERLESLAALVPALALAGGRGGPSLLLFGDDLRSQAQAAI